MPQNICQPYVGGVSVRSRLFIEIQGGALLKSKDRSRVDAVPFAGAVQDGARPPIQSRAVIVGLESFAKHRFLLHIRTNLHIPLSQVSLILVQTKSLFLVEADLVSFQVCRPEDSGTITE